RAQRNGRTQSDLQHAESAVGQCARERHGVLLGSIMSTGTTTARRSKSAMIIGSLLVAPERASSANTIASSCSRARRPHLALNCVAPSREFTEIFRGPTIEVVGSFAEACNAG